MSISGRMRVTTQVTSVENHLIAQNSKSLLKLLSVCGLLGDNTYPFASFVAQHVHALSGSCNAFPKILAVELIARRACVQTVWPDAIAIPAPRAHFAGSLGVLQYVRVTCCRCSAQTRTPCTILRIWERSQNSHKRGESCLSSILGSARNFCLLFLCLDENLPHAS